ncbi:ABC transporter substrate-binding protein [Microtetraspora sp. NBRC 13810]|uniref:iron-siderophore ABC transporter substrate-binding protein n=1 Tax=Microtetraspora sp. NBRC 13810 TaxID=3030990 RepID=UPI0024A3730C|nr:iron-siderophore ABC transporter substrate-binding protein [Microtetraspora sp. NBRC 13810]GLW07630.1 ABC transporter substrate-binding protein [Microtetraspora sp. NBRC 13810]
MPPSSQRARVFTAFASLLLLLTTVAACGSGTGTGAAAPESSAPANAAFPVTIEHKFGSTTITAEPQRVFTLGLTDQDAVLALGKVPVGTTDWFGGFPGAIGPWATGKLGGAPVPTLVKDTGTGPPVEQIAALRPDLILALYAGLTKEQYDTLSKFAPVVAQPKEYNDYGIPWQQQTETTGRALGKPAEAKALVEGVERKFATLRREHPEFAGATGLVATPYEGFFVYGSQDPRSRTLSSLGLKLPTDLDKVIGDQFGANISKERGDLLDQDVVVWTVPDLAKDVTTLRADPVYKDLKVVKESREVFLGESTDYGAAFSFVTVLSLPYVLDRLVPQLAAAVDGDAATKVAQTTS